MRSPMIVAGRSRPISRVFVLDTILVIRFLAMGHLNWEDRVILSKEDFFRHWFFVCGWASPSKAPHPDLGRILACGSTYSLRLPGLMDQWPIADFTLQRKSGTSEEFRPHFFKPVGIAAYSCGAAMAFHHLHYERILGFQIWILSPPVVAHMSLTHCSRVN